MVVDAAMLCAEGLGGELLEDLRALRPEIDTFAPVPPAAMNALVDAADPAADSPLVVVFDAVQPWDTQRRCANFVESYNHQLAPQVRASPLPGA